MKQKKTSKRVVVITDNEELYKSFQRAFKFLLQIDTMWMVRDTYFLSPVEILNQDVIINDVTEEPNIEKHVISLRINFYSNTIIHIGFYRGKYADTSTFYITLPFLLKDLLRIVRSSEPLSKQEIALSLASWLSQNSHNIQNLLNTPAGRDRCVNLINQIFECLKPSFQIFQEKERVIRMINSSVDRYKIASKLIMLFEKLKSFSGRG